jgi:Flp pilus assembly pilin Flp
MLKLYVWVKDLLTNEQGQDMVEYALITVIVSVAIVLAVLAILPGAFTAWANTIKACITAPTTSCSF